MAEAGDTPQRIAVRTAEASYRVHAEAVRVGDDVLVWIWGGEKPHIGAVAAAQPRPSLEREARTSATASVLTYLGHKEDVVVKMAAEALSAALATRVVVTAGIHWDALSAPAIETILDRCREVVARLTERLQQREES